MNKFKPGFYISVILSLLVPIIASSQRSINPETVSGSQLVHYSDSLRAVARNKHEEDYTIPSFTRLRKAIVAAESFNDTARINNLAEALIGLKSKEVPYDIVMNIQKDPASTLAFSWYTNAGVTGEKIEIIKGRVKSPKQFGKPSLIMTAKVIPLNNINYCVPSNDLLKLTGIPDNTKKSYTSNKALVTGLKPNATYSYRVGKEGYWSETGTFKTANRKGDFSFIYATDPQANKYENFDISQRTTHSARQMFPAANFWLHCGDMIETSGKNNSEWEWEQFFMTQQDIFLNCPFAPVTGNHDVSSNRNFTSHFNTDTTKFYYATSKAPGSVYSFVYGNTLFLALSFEDYNVPGYLDALAKWARKEVNAHPGVKWRIAYYHKTIYTGSESHQKDNDGILIRNRIAPLFDSLKIDLALQGHDHIYEVIGPVKDKKLVPDAISNQTRVSPDKRENVTGLINGVYNVKEGTLYFLNNSSGKKKYEPRTKEQMDSDETRLGVQNYFGLFTGRFGQTGRPTFSNVNVTGDSIIIKTYEVNEEGIHSLFDEIKIVKK